VRILERRITRISRKVRPLIPESEPEHEWVSLTPFFELKEIRELQAYRAAAGIKGDAAFFNDPVIAQFFDRARRRRDAAS
jgi:hypothetical protein